MLQTPYSQLAEALSKGEWQDPVSSISLLKCINCPGFGRDFLLGLALMGV